MFLLNNLLWLWLQRHVRRTRPTHEDDRRVLHAVVLGPLELVHIRYKQECVLGNHYHPYTERWTLVTGKAVATVMRQKAPTIRQTVTMCAGSKLTIGINEPHAITASEGAILLIVKPAAYVAKSFTLV